MKLQRKLSVDKFLRPGTKSRRYFALLPAAIRIIRKEGWRAFWRRARSYCAQQSRSGRLKVKPLKINLRAVTSRAVVSGDRKPRIPYSREEVIDFLEGLTADAPEKEYINAHKMRFYETLSLASSVITQDATKVLDVGSHPKSLPTLLKRFLGACVTCCNNGGGAVTIMNPKRAEQFQFNVDKVDVEKEALPYADATFDLVLCCEVLEHLTCDPMFMLAEINRVLKWRGFLLLTTPNICSHRSVKAVLESEHPGTATEYYIVGNTYDIHNRHNREYTPQEVKHLLKCAGFEVMTLETKDIWSGPDADIIDLLGRLGKPTIMRGDCIFALARKTSPVLERYPSKFYYLR